MGQFPNPDTQFKPGESGNPDGRPKGSRSLSTIIRDLMEKEGFDWDLVPNTTAEFKEKYTGKAAWEAIVYVAVGEARAGNIKAMEWLRKAGYGDKLEITPPDGRVSIFDAQRLVIEIVDGAGSGEADAEQAPGDVAKPAK